MLVCDFFSEDMHLEEEELYILYVRKLSSTDNVRSRRAPKQPAINFRYDREQKREKENDQFYTFSHYSEIDLVMSETKR